MNILKTKLKNIMLRLFGLAVLAIGAYMAYTYGFQAGTWMNPPALSGIAFSLIGLSRVFR